LLAVLTFSIAIFLQPKDAIKIPMWINIFGLLTTLCYSGFLIWAWIEAKKTKPPLDPAVLPERPKFWLMAALEWGVFFSTILWFFCIALAV
jgi:hypothetical protein